MEYWRNGVLLRNPSLQYSTTPTLQLIMVLLEILE
jgi:hypothetical protein